MKEALKKWQKEKRLRQIQEKKSKKEPFRPVANVPRQLSEFQHSFQNSNSQMNTTKISTKTDINQKVVAPSQNAQRNVSFQCVMSLFSYTDSTVRRSPL
jgi:16S rRNA G527 N7-methylase RsmG